MIYINRNATNSICLTLTESVTITPVYFIFSFQRYASLTTQESLIYFTTPDLSTTQNRFNLFELIEADYDASPAGSISGGNDIPLYLIPGQYEYKVYQSTSDSLNPNTFGDLLETGKMVVGDMTVEGQNTSVDSIYQ